MYFKLSDLGGNKKLTRVVDIQTNEQNSLTRASLKELMSILNDTLRDEKFASLLFTSTNPKFFSNGLDASNVMATPDDELDYLNRIPLSALKRTKQAINAPILERFETTLKHTCESFTTPLIVSNFRESMKALAEKRRPQYLD